MGRWWSRPKFKNVVAFLLIVAGLISNANAQNDFFWSFADLNGGSANGDVQGEFNVGESGSLFLYYSTFRNDLPGALLDFAISHSGVLEFTAAETFDYDILLNGTDISDRWGDAFGVGTVAMDGQLASVNAFTVINGTGILAANGPESTGLLDSGYDSGAEAFLFARLDFVAVGVGETDIETTDASGCNDADCLSFEFGNATITVVPEPGFGAIVFCAALHGAGVARKRRNFGQRAKFTV